MSKNANLTLTPGVSRKRKEREGFDALNALKPPTTQAAEEANNNRLLAGYLAHEFLTRGTLFGQKWDPARASAVPIGADPKKKSHQHSSPRAEPRKAAATPITKPQAYADVAHLLKTDGAHIPGIVNPTQLARWLQK